MKVSRCLRLRNLPAGRLQASLSPNVLRLFGLPTAVPRSLSIGALCKIAAGFGAMFVSFGFVGAVLVATSLIAGVGGIKWLALPSTMPTSECPTTPFERRRTGLVFSQAELCRRLPDLMSPVHSAAEATIRECQSTFSTHRWNCSALSSVPLLEPDLVKGTREQAFVYALAAAAVADRVARACSAGSVDYCTCGPGTQVVVTVDEHSGIVDDARVEFKWRGCSDNVEYGIDVSREWVDAPFRGRGARSIGPGGEFLPDSDDYLVDTTPTTPVPSTEAPETPKPPAERWNKAAVNRHNAEVGRTLLAQNTFRKCKCHGVSSSCHIRTCWDRLRPLSEVAKSLVKRYNVATLVREPPRSHPLVPTANPSFDDKLVYIQPSEDHCALTPGRQCSPKPLNTSAYGLCAHLCCGRGYHAKTVLVTEQCHCRYVHCCYVKCKTCSYYQDVNYCN